MHDKPLPRSLTPTKIVPVSAMKARLLLCVALSVTLSSAVWAGSSVLSQKLEKMTQSLVSGYRGARTMENGPQTAAIFTFNTPERLARQRVGFAMSELLTHHFVNDQSFKVVERTELARVMDEQKLQVTGAVDPSKAVQVGKLAGARYLLLGSVEKVGASYQVNARLVDAETADVVSTAYVEIPAETFEEEAKPYLVLVPDRQTIGLYLLYNHRQNGSAGSGYSFVRGGTPGAMAPQAFALGMIGGGFRFLPSHRWMADGSIAVVTGADKTGVGTGNSMGDREIGPGKSVMLSGTFNWLVPLSASARGILGAGLKGYRLTADNVNFNRSLVPSLRAGFEVKPQGRLGLGFFLNYDLLAVTGSDGFAPDGHVIRLNRLSLEPTVAVYF